MGNILKGFWGITLIIAGQAIISACIWEGLPGYEFESRAFTYNGLDETMV